MFPAPTFTFPAIMGILNLTPDSFFDGGGFPLLKDQLKQVERMITEGASIIDLGAVSTRPGSAQVSSEEEASRLLPVLEAVCREFPRQYFSVDTYRSKIAETAIDKGASMINDIYGGRFDGEMFRIITESKVDYVMMHMLGTPEDMQKNPEYQDVVEEVIGFFMEQLNRMQDAGCRIFLDPGFGFGKSVDDNYRLLENIGKIKALGYPVVVGLSRKSMISKVLGIKPGQALNGTTVLNTIALLKGADILRVHDVKEAAEAIRLVAMLKDEGKK